MCLISHYTRLEAAESILQSMTLRLSLGSFLSANDPRETKYWHFNVPEINAVHDFQLLHEREISDRIKRNIGSLSFTRDTNAIEGCYRPRMWAQYAENHTGICIIFNRDRLLRSIHGTLDPIGRVYAENIEYFSPECDFDPMGHMNITRDDIIQENVNVIAEQIMEEPYRSFYFFRKHLDWQDEAEFRVLFKTNVNNDDTVRYEYFIPCLHAIEAVLFGVDCPDLGVLDPNNDRINEDTSYRIDQYNHIIDLCEEHSIDYHRVRWTNGVPETDPLPVVVL